MSDIKALKDSIETLSQAKKVKMGKLKEAVKETRESRQTQAGQSPRPA
ncbi:unnamed protein product [marine sediment metagenome]|uniref:Uncharacterized protein n=1 Tax=marine sediment metagenome TaxID=412755 RepID=X1SMN7_9ZZZZ